MNTQTYVLIAVIALVGILIFGKGAIANKLREILRNFLELRNEQFADDSDDEPASEAQALEDLETEAYESARFLEFVAKETNRPMLLEHARAAGKCLFDDPNTP